VQSLGRELKGSKFRDFEISRFAEGERSKEKIIRSDLVQLQGQVGLSVIQSCQCESHRKSSKMTKKYLSSKTPRTKANFLA